MFNFYRKILAAVKFQKGCSRSRKKKVKQIIKWVRSVSAGGDYDPNCHQIFKGTVKESFKYGKNYMVVKFYYVNYKERKFMKKSIIQVFTRV